ncbi:unnamed protein product, partial [Effrenium voratum]
SGLFADIMDLIFGVNTMDTFFARGTSLQKWRELDVQPQAYNPLVGEFWNTLSSLAFYVPGGVWSIWWARRPSIVVGLGSAIFHATQSYAGQMLDELPMALMGLGYMWCTYDLHWLTMPPYRTEIFTIFHMVVFGAWFCYLAFQNYEIFQLSFVFQRVRPRCVPLNAGLSSLADFAGTTNDGCR